MDPMQLLRELTEAQRTIDSASIEDTRALRDGTTELVTLLAKAIDLSTQLMPMAKKNDRDLREVCMVISSLAAIHGAIDDMRREHERRMSQLAARRG